MKITKLLVLLSCLFTMNAFAQDPSKDFDSAIRNSDVLKSYGFEVVGEKSITSRIGAAGIIFYPVYALNAIGGQKYSQVNFEVAFNGQTKKMKCEVQDLTEYNRITVYNCRIAGEKQLPQGVTSDHQKGLTFGESNVIASFNY